MKPNLMILAAGMGSRYGGLKQVDGVGPSNEAIIEYSVYDAIRAGFGKVIFVIRKSIEADFKEKFKGKFEGKIEVVYAFQEMDSCTEGVENIPERTKPWGTSHAVLAAESQVDAPFAVINADDYYGVEAFRQIADFLTNEARADHYGMVGYILNNTLSDNGSVSRGVCATDDHDYLSSVTERTKIEKKEGIIYFEDEQGSHSLAENTVVSMNFFGFHPSIFKPLRTQFHAFIAANRDKPKGEFFIPLTVDALIKSGEITMKVLTSNDKWYGVTYQEDKPVVQEAFQRLVDNKLYPSPLW